ncbi:MAG: hypothetical protein JNL69_13585, partial [Bacteroidia bacterium]|nr:hypothetical protein [Bacteroidia bacterium]
IDSIISSNGDIQMILGFNGEIDFMNYYYTPITVPMPESVDSMQVKNPSWMYSINKMSKKGNGLRLFMIRDSFTQYLKLFLSPNFDYSFYAWTPKIPVDVAIESKPDIVIYEMLEMFSNYLLVLPPEIEADSTFIKKYFP